MDETLNAKILKKDASLDVGTALFGRIVGKYISPKVHQLAALRLGIPKEDGKLILESEMDLLYLTDFSLHDLRFRITSNSLKKYNKEDNKLLGSKTNLIERYKLFIGVNSKEEESVINSWISSKLSIFEIVKVTPPIITVRDLLDSNNDNLETIIDRNASLTLVKNMIWAFRLTKFAGLGATSGVSFLFSSDDKNRLLNNWEKIVKKSSGNHISRLLYIYLFRVNRKYGIPVFSELLM